MAAIPRIAPISEFRSRQNELLQQLAEGPLVLTQHGRAAAVVVSPEDWNALIDRLEDLEDSLMVWQAKEETRRDPTALRPWDEVKADLVAEGLLDEQAQL